jgi:hypothetical protein
MAMTNAERQKKYRQRRNALARRAETFDRRLNEAFQDLAQQITIGEMISIAEMQGPDVPVILARQLLRHLQEAGRVQLEVYDFRRKQEGRLVPAEMSVSSEMWSNWSTLPPSVATHDRCDLEAPRLAITDRTRPARWATLKIAMWPAPKPKPKPKIP